MLQLSLVLEMYFANRLDICCGDVIRLLTHCVLVNFLIIKMKRYAANVMSMGNVFRKTCKHMLSSRGSYIGILCSYQ